MRVSLRTSSTLLAGLLTASVVLAACSSPEEEAPAPEPTTVDPTVVVEKSAAPEPVLPPTWPLTGVEAAVEARPAVAVKIENSTQSRPQTGLESADVVWEEMVEGGITRFNAVYHSDIPETVGPIRSVRPMDAAIAAPLGGLIVMSGGQTQYVQAMRDAGLQVLSHDEGAPGLYRNSSRVAPHNVYGSMEDFLAAANDSRTVPPPAQFGFAVSAAGASAVTAGTPAARLDTTFPSSSPSWEWDGSRWLRNEGSSAAVSSTGERLSATNVVVLRVQVVDTGTKDPAGNPVPETVLEGTGEAIVATGGQTVTGTWSKGAVGDPLVLTGADGQPLLLAPGNTWVELVPTNGSVTIS